MFIGLFALAFAQAPGAAAPAQGAPQGSPFMSILSLLLIFVAFFFLIMWPQQKAQKQHKKMIEALKKGDHVITRGGLHGTITGFDSNDLTIKVANNVEVKVIRSAVDGITKEGSGE